MFLFFAILLTLFGAGLIYTCLTKNPAITVSDEGIDLDYAFSDGRLINWNEVETINAVHLNPFFGDEGSMILLKDGKKIMISPRDYVNAYEIRAFLHDHISVHTRSIESKSRQIVLSKEPKLYSGNPWTSYNNILFLGITGALVFIALWHSLPLVLLILPFFYLFVGSQMYYFQVKEDKLVVKNHYWLWYKKSYELEQLRSLIYELHGKISSALGIVLNDFTTKRFGAGSLRKKDWKQLMHDMQSMHIDFKNGELLV